MLCCDPTTAVSLANSLGAPQSFRDLDASRAIDGRVHSQLSLQQIESASDDSEEIDDGQQYYVVAGVYTNESLFRAKLHPQLPSNSLSSECWCRLVKSIKDVLSEAIEKQGTTIRDYKNSAGTSGGFEASLAVYGRKGLPCLSCFSTLKEVRIDQRTSVFCPSCQKLNSSETTDEEEEEIESTTELVVETRNTTKRKKVIGTKNNESQVNSSLTGKKRRSERKMITEEKENNQPDNDNLQSSMTGHKQRTKRGKKSSFIPTEPNRID